MVAAASMACLMVAAPWNLKSPPTTTLSSSNTTLKFKLKCCATTQQQQPLVHNDDLQALLQAGIFHYSSTAFFLTLQLSSFFSDSSFRFASQSPQPTKSSSTFGGRFPEARYLGKHGNHYLRNSEVTIKELEYAEGAVGDFGKDNRAGIEGTLHRISAIRSRNGGIVGLTCRIGRAVTGHIDMVYDLLQYGKSILFLGRPGVGKTTVMREIARVLSDDFHKRVVIVDTSNEIGGDGNIPHAAIGGARRMQVPMPSMQHSVMIEAVENHMPEVIIVDEIGTEAEARACRSIAERGIMLIGTAHGHQIDNVMKNPTLSDLIGGIESVTLGDVEARARKCQKTILERKAPPTFDFLIEMRDRHYWITHQTDKSVDMLLRGKIPQVEVRKRDENSKVVIEKSKAYDKCQI
ncbi:F-box protein [Trifolium pratense]|uniref:F-box protein n=1 Tax=Trifolium pratense TaxID=57577 RepID=A0A2K3MMU4_TRIPR|nr:F-box protein [Trifolium pratense]